MALIASNKSGVICAKCDNLITTGTIRDVKNGVHEHFSCPRFIKLREDDNSKYLDWLMNEFKIQGDLRSDQ